MKRLRRLLVCRSRHLFIIFLFLVCLILSMPAPAPGDVGVIPPIRALDPCFGSSVTLDIIDESAVDLETDFVGFGMATYYIGTYKYQLTLSGTTVADVISAYRKIPFGPTLSTAATNHVAMDDTIIIYGGNVDITIFGRSVNEEKSGIFGAHGVITGAVTFNGQNISTLKGTYRLADSPKRLCFFLE